MSEVLPALSPILTRREARAVRRHGITGPLFVPIIGGNVVRILIAGSGPKLLAEELNRLTLLGSDNAAALLTLLISREALENGEYATAALERCRTAATAGHSYAQYVMAWVNQKAGKNGEAFRFLKLAMAGRFLPAFIDAARFARDGVGVKSPDRHAALKIFWVAHKMGHRSALAFIARDLLQGSAGLLARLAGLLLLLPALLRATLYSARQPLSEKAFSVPLGNRPLLRG